MTPEERWIKIDRALITVAELQALHEREMVELRAMLKNLNASIKTLERFVGNNPQ